MTVALLPVLCLLLALIAWAALRAFHKADAGFALLRGTGADLDGQSRFCARTGLANHRGACEWLHRFFADKGSRPVVMVAHFAPVEGDSGFEMMLASQVASVLSREAPGESFVARHSAGQYLLALAGPIEPAILITHARRISAALAELLDDGRSLRLGVAIAGGADDPAALIKRGVQAACEGTVGGKVAVNFVDPEIRAKYARGNLAAEDLAAAIAGGEVEPFFQPFIELGTGRVLGFEVLARWRDSEGYLHMPAEFLPMAEEHGHVREMYQTLLATAAKEARSWPAEWSFALNLSAVQFSDETLVEDTLATLREFELGPERLEIEISEPALAGQPELARALIARFHEAGVRVTLDNFGTGRLHLKELARFSFDRIKVEQSALLDSAGSELGLALGLIAATAQHLGVSVLVQGIETLASAEVAQQHGCAIGQGYLYGRPNRETEYFHLQGILAPPSDKAA